jgi:lipopolysaccharide/colanic/teichoic acid biosynthesis glycosyltransferase
MSGEIELERGGARLAASIAWYDLWKRTVDLAGSAVLLIALSPLLIIVAVAVAVSSPGPVFFSQQRVGRLARPFVMYKFRTMFDGADDAVHREFVTTMMREGYAASDDGLQKLVDDARVTAIGGLLRRLSLDELPQLFNGIRGDMSLVGPRPALGWERELFSPEHQRRFQVKPGMTGLWQVSGRSRLSMLQALDLDVEYVERRTFWLDVAIVLRTIPVVLTRRGAT